MPEPDRRQFPDLAAGSAGRLAPTPIPALQIAAAALVGQLTGAAGSTP